MTGTTGQYYTDQEITEMAEEMRNPISGELITPTILYCLHDGCEQTRYDIDGFPWEISMQRSQAIVEGEPSRMNPYCPNHKPTERSLRI